MENKNQIITEEAKYLLSRIEKITGKVEALERKQAKTSRAVQDIEEEYPLLPPEADDLSKAVQKKGVEALGGKKSPAYANIELRRRVYQDIYMEIKRQYGLINEVGRQMSYKKLKRKYLQGAFSVVEEYETPITLANEIDAINEAGDME